MTSVFEKLTNIIEQVKEETSVFNSHIILNQNEDIKKHYIKMLYVLAGIDGPINQTEAKFLNKIMRSIGLQDVSAFQQHVTEIQGHELQTFLQAVCNKRLQQSFFLDGIMLVMLDGAANEEEIHFLTELAEMMKISSEELVAIGQLAAIILEKDKEGFQNLQKDNVYIDTLSDYQGYTSPFALTVIDKAVIEGEQVWTGSIVLNDRVAVKGTLRIKDANIVFRKNGLLHLCEGVNLVIENSTCTGVEIIGGNITNLHIRNCMFDGQKDKSIIKINSCKDAAIEHSRFVCNGSNDGGAIVYLEKGFIQACTFKNWTVKGASVKQVQAISSVFIKGSTSNILKKDCFCKD